MIKCIVCKSKNPDYAEYCLKCGVKIIKAWTPSERIEFYRSCLRKITSEGGEGNFVVFTIPGDLFIQFAGEVNNPTVVLDIPYQNIPPGKAYVLERVIYAETGKTPYRGEMSYQAEMNVEQAAQITETLFRQLYNLPENYPLTSVELVLE